jgi:hypothetical protein
MNETHPLIAAIQSKDVDALRKAIWDLNQDPAFASSLAQILVEDWHDSHEDIAFELGLMGDPGSVGALAKATTIRFDYLIRWGNLHEFQRKCAYALARIGTIESREALEELARNEDPYIRGCGEEGLQSWPMPHMRGD